MIAALTGDRQGAIGVHVKNLPRDRRADMQAGTRADVSQIFAEEEIKNLGLEEVEFEDNSNIWAITVGFSRPWDRPKEAFVGLDVAMGELPLRRSYKIVRLSDADGKVISVTSRDVPMPAL